MKWDRFPWYIHKGLYFIAFLILSLFYYNITDVIKSGFIRNSTIQEGCMKKIIAVSLGCMIGISMLMLGMAVSKDYTGCYICSGKSGTYVKYKGDDTFDKRKKAKALGCEVGGTSSSCDAANYTILGTVD